MTQGRLNQLNELVPLYERGVINTDYLASFFGVSQRHALRMIRNEVGVVKRSACNRIGDDIRQYVLDLKLEHPEYNCQWISEIVSDKYERSISQPSIWRILRQNGVSPAIPTKRKVRSRFEAAECGDLVQMDTSWGYWLNGERVCLILLLDDFSRYILHAEFFLNDSAYNNMQMISEVIYMHGVFKVLYTDNASFFKPIRHNQSIYQVHKQSEYESEITKSCRDVGITHITHKPYQPQGKGKIERIFRFIQERFVSQIKPDWSLEILNIELWEWIDWYNENHINRTTGHTPKERFNPNGFSSLPAEKSLADIFCHKSTRKVDACNQFSYDGITYTIPKEHCLVACKIDLAIHPLNCIRIIHQSKYICTIPMPIEEILQKVEEKKRKKEKENQHEAYFEKYN